MLGVILLLIQGICQLMRPRTLFIALSVFVLVGIAAALSYYHSQQSLTVESIPAPAAVLPSQSAPSSIPQVLASASPGTVLVQPSPAMSPLPSKASNPNPDLTVDSNGLSKATVILATNEGVIKFKFYPNEAPLTVKRYIELVNQGFYNGLVFHRVVAGFVVQTGDPQGTGSGGSGQKLKAEFSARHHVEGTVAMARAADPDSADSQFYITLAPQPHLDRSYTVFGQVSKEWMRSERFKKATASPLQSSSNAFV